jgi:outer membrane receptor for ferrienterochelin and colicins
MNKYFIAVLLAVISFTASAKKKNSKTETFKVYGVCFQCKERIETGLELKGIYKADWNVQTHMLTVSYDSTRFSRRDIQKKMAELGHDSEGFLSDKSTYDELPDCCHYERELLPKTSASIEELTVDTFKAPVFQTISGKVFEQNKAGKILLLESAIIRDLKGKENSITDSNGVFQLTTSLPTQISVSYIGLKTDTFNIESPDNINLILKSAFAKKLKEVEITSRIKSSYISSLSTLNTLKIGTKELAKAACCNLSESFETSPSIDVSYADAVTGIKQIQLLGLSGNYTQITTENTPEIHGLSSIYGLTFIPGPWIESIEVTKGTGSVANGYESMAGQINIEEKKTHNSDKVFVNSYANVLGRVETTVDLAKNIDDKWSTALLTHANGVLMKSDNNNDGFLDMPIGRQFNVINRWRYTNNKGLFSQFIIKALNDQRQSGQVEFDPKLDKLGSQKYGVGIDIQQYAFTGKLGYVFPEQEYKSIGFIVSGNTYTNNAYYGLTKYDGKQNSLYANLIYQSIIGNTAHQYRAGLSMVNDVVDETIKTRNFKRKEIVPGAFIEYTYKPNEKFTAIAGLRADYHNQYGLIATPRLHLKYDLTSNTNLRFSAGSGFRTANIFSENIGLFASSRQYSILNPSSNYGYGLAPEKAWNYGLNFVHNFTLNHRKGSLSFDAYRTDFVNQVVVDVDASPQGIAFYNLVGQSFSNSIQAELDYELFKRFDVRLAYRWLDVQTNYGGTMRQKPLQANHRAFINLAYETKNHWKFDWTTQWLSRKRLPLTSSNPIDKQLDNYSPAYVQMSGQVTKQFTHKWDVYVGVENLTNYKQQNPILSADQPFSPYFDGSMIWGPINGRMAYVGMRFKVE